MSTHLTTLLELALDLVASRHESVENMEVQIRLLLGNGVSREQMTQALVDAFVYRQEDKDYQRYRRPRLKASTRLWWFATGAGRRALAGR